jgi:paraquat-inducible protein A
MSDVSALPEANSRQNRRRPAGGSTARVCLVLSLTFLPLGLTLPVLETTRLWVFKSSYSLIDTVWALIEAGELALGFLIAAFSLLTPAIKAFAITALHMRPAGSDAGRFVNWIDRIGKWSLTDVLVVAMLIVLASGTGLELTAQPGLWFFAASAVLLMTASHLVVRDLRYS